MRTSTMKLSMKNLLVMLGMIALSPWMVSAQIRLSGLTLYTCDANGTWDLNYGWNTLRGEPLDAFNVYLFTNTINAPTFLNSGNTDASLNPNTILPVGAHTFGFACNLAPNGYLGLNLYFNDDVTRNRITVVVPNDGSPGFSVVPAGFDTYGHPNGHRASSGSLSFAAGGFIVTLSGFQTTLPRPDIVSTYATGHDGVPDTAGTFTLTVVPAPQPIVLSGMTMYTATANGGQTGSSTWNTRGSDFSYNIYMFAGTVGSPSFLNSGDSDLSLNPNLSLTPGTHVIHFTAETTPSGNLGINLYFNNNPTNRITAVVPIDGTSNFSVVPASASTFGLNGTQSGAGKLSFRIGDTSVRLSDLHVILPRVDLVGGYSPSPDGGPDTTGSLTLVVAPPPLEVAIEVSEVRVCWLAEANKSYRVQYRSTATANLWNDLGGLVQGDGTRKCVNDPVSASQPTRFYQVIALP